MRSDSSNYSAVYHNAKPSLSTPEERAHAKAAKETLEKSEEMWVLCVVYIV
jgi:hypothetical protein